MRTKVLVASRAAWESPGMKTIVREASVRWRAGKKRPTATVSTGRGVFRPADFLLGRVREPHADAAELIAAAHAISFCLALSHALRLKTFAKGEVIVTAAATMVRTVEGWTITNMHLDVVSRLAGINQGRFIDAAIRAKISCIVSRSLRANVSMNAKLET
jgi:osmotically inducible protein OsmC